jgi:hypothetical protein
MFELMPVYRSANLEPREVFQLYLDRNYDRLTESFFNVFDYLNETTYQELEGTTRASIIQFVQVFLTVFTQPDFVIPERYIYRFVDQNELISNIVAMTPFHNTDGFLELLRYAPSNLVKILTLYSARNRIRFDRRGFFDAHPQLASLWYCKFCSLYKTALVNKDACQHMEEHLSYHDERMILTTDMAEPYFGSTYVDGVIDRHVKPFLNNVVRRSARFTAQNNPNPKKIAVISDLWCTTHSVYRNYLAFVKELAKDFHLTFFHVFKGREELDVSDFQEVHRLDFRDGSLDIGPLASNDFVAVYFPDVGMTLSSIMLANYRLAPIQICSPGHSVSTWGSEIDYFISGADVEGADGPEKRYSERLVLLPGMGVVHNQPLYTLTGRQKTVPEVVVNFPTSGQKLNFKFLQTLRKLLDQVRRPLRFRFFPAVLNQKNGYLPFLTEVQQVLGRSSAILDVKPFLAYREYMGFMEEGDLTLDSYHFGGCNTVADSLFVRRPMVVWEGDKWYNRIGGAMMRRAGLEELVCNSEEGYLEKTIRLVHDDAWREDLTARLRAADINNSIFSTADAPSFRRAVDFLIANHDRLKAQPGRLPIRIL